MNKITRLCFLALAGIVSAFAQTATTSTTLCAAVTSTATNSICLTSITNVVAQTLIFVDGETMQVVGEPTQTTAVRVVRGYSVYGPGLHANGAKAWIGLVPAKSVVPGANGFAPGTFVNQGTCVRSAAALPYAPVVYYNLGLLRDCDATTLVWRPYLSSGPTVFVTDAGANNAITSAIGSQPAYIGLTVSVTLAHSLQAGANTFAYAGGTALNVKSSKNPASNIGTAYVSTGVVTLQLALISSTQTWLDISQ